MNHFYKKILVILLATFSSFVFSEVDIDQLKNDKEVESTSISKRQTKKIKQIYSDSSFNERIASIFYKTIKDFIEDDFSYCELRLIDNFINTLKNEGLKVDQDSIEDYLKILRTFNYIDDILFDILSYVTEDHFNFKNINLNHQPFKTILDRQSLLEKNPLDELYVDFKQWPDEKNSCTYQSFVELKRQVRNKEGEYSKKSKELKVLNKKALESKIISLSTFNKLEFLRKKSALKKRMIWIKDYFSTIFKAKNKMKPISYDYTTNNLELENKFSTEKVRRFHSITRRKLLYRKYNETQIILLSQILQKASRRMGVDPDTISGRPYITQEFNILTPSGERETYVERIDLDPQSQYNLARRLLRRDMVQLEMMESFHKLHITHEDVVMAGLETGYISLEDIALVVKYDDLWNPEQIPFLKVLGFIFTIGRYSTFFLPSPFNIAATIAMGIAEGIADHKLSSGADHDNPATFIE